MIYDGQLVKEWLSEADAEAEANAQHAAIDQRRREHDKIQRRLDEATERRHARNFQSYMDDLRAGKQPRERDKFLAMHIVQFTKRKPRMQLCLNVLKRTAWTERPTQFVDGYGEFRSTTAGERGGYGLH